MPLRGPAPLGEIDAARDPAALAPLWAVAHPLGPCAGDPAPSGEDSWGIEEDGRLVALGSLRSWGRVGTIHGLCVAEPARRRGLGAALIEELSQQLQRRDSAVIGIELDQAEAMGGGALAALARCGFKPLHLSFVLEAAVPGADMAATAPETVLLQGASGAEAAGMAGPIAASADSGFDPVPWLRERLARQEAEMLVVGGAALAVLPATGGGDALAVSMLLCAEGPPRQALVPVLDALASLARRRGLSRLHVAAPSRQWDATRALLEAGFRPRASYLRLTRQGFPERADVGRTALGTWR